MHRVRRRASSLTLLGPAFSWWLDVTGHTPYGGKASVGGRLIVDESKVLPYELLLTYSTN